MIRLEYLLKKDGYLFALMLITVPLAGELKFYPVNEVYRISFGAPAFFFFLLLLRHVPAVLSGLLTGAAVVAFRIGLACWGGEHAGFTEAFFSQYPSFFFYFTYACLFYVLKVRHFRDRPLMIGFLGFLIEIVSDTVEMAVQFSGGQPIMIPDKLADIAVIAVSHTFIVLSFFNVMKLHEAQVREKQTRKQHEHMLMIVSNLYEETIHLKKTLKTTEHVTKESYQLYREMSGNDPELGSRMLRLAGEIHEVKKDNQRIFAGLSKLISNERFRDYMDAAALIGLVIRINEKYAESLGKDIQFQSVIEGEHPDYHVFTVLSILNNLTANAVEAMGDRGEICLTLRRAEDDTAEFQAEDDGPGIPEKIGEIVYDPGFTSKYDEFGTPSTGIGLSYVKEIVTELDGDISFHNKPKGVIFTIQLPVRHLIAERGSS
ncbi:ATP-binding protein [Bacillus amyloliquefaciens]|uniref:histidine kinase n=1 Tax=Bacillus amyloliquefaciens TaxID=1390 RepID=A0AAP7TA37_BACAM|nr:sensor histidine kinase [Bacillus amyloliquefaciens]OIK19988.1 ATP-binding protein [Bacillus amyloliquefaciens]